jgi:hypothetical protein
METKQYVAEIEKSAKVAESLAALNAYKVSTIRESKDAELIAAQNELAKARENYKKVVNNVMLADELYNNLQTECVRLAVSEFAHTHNCLNFAVWFDANDKDIQTSVIDTPAKLGAKIKELHENFAKGAKVARKKSATKAELAEELQRRLAEIEALKAELAK